MRPFVRFMLLSLLLAAGRASAAEPQAPALTAAAAQEITAVRYGLETVADLAGRGIITAGQA